MSLDRNLYLHIISIPAVAALISDRCYPMGEVPRKPTYPYLTLRRLSNERHPNLGGDSGLQDPLYRATIYADSAPDARTVRDTLAAALQMATGDIGEVGNETTVRRIFVDDDTDDYAQPKHGEEDGTAMATVDFVVWFVFE